MEDLHHSTDDAWTDSVSNDALEQLELQVRSEGGATEIVLTADNEDDALFNRHVQSH